MFCELLSTGIDIHNIVQWSTPFLSFLGGFFSLPPSTYSNTTSSYNVALRMWLGDLQAAGVDLNQFGQKEKSLFDSETLNRCILIHQGRYSGFIRLINFTYGPSPDDWHLWVSELSDDWFEDFWGLVEEQEDVMPGSWPGDNPYKM